MLSGHSPTWSVAGSNVSAGVSQSPYTRQALVTISLVDFSYSFGLGTGHLAYSFWHFQPPRDLLARDQYKLLLQDSRERKKIPGISCGIPVRHLQHPRLISNPETTLNVDSKDNEEFVNMQRFIALPLFSIVSFYDRNYVTVISTRKVVMGLLMSLL